MTLLGMLSACGKSDDGRPTGDFVPADTPTAPVFNGVSSGRLTDEGVLLEWHDAVDAESDTEDIVYVAYSGVGDDPVNVRDPVGVSVPGANQLLVQDLDPESYRFVVRARDPGGLEDNNRASVRVSLLDEVAPEFEGVVGSVAQGPTDLLVQWKAGSDDETPEHQLRYMVYAARQSDRVFEQEPVLSEPGATSIVLSLEQGWPQYWVGVRAMDAAGNMDSNERTAALDAPEDEPPVFSGVTSSESLTEGVILRWSPGVDNASASANLRFHVHWARMTGGQDLSRADLITEPGVNQVQINDLIAGAEYFFIVRAVDEAGNIDQNSFEHQVATLPRDNVFPTFFGLKDVESLTPTSIHVTWHVATDARTSSANMVYEVYLSETQPISLADGPTFVPPPGRLEAELVGLEPETEYFVSVRAVDEAGNPSILGSDLAVTTLAASSDSVPPTLEGGVTASLVPSDSDMLLVRWDGMLDNRVEETEIRGHVCVGLKESDCSGNKFFKNYNVVGAFGATNVFVSGLQPRSDYYVGVRLEDKNGNIETLTTGGAGSTATSFTTNVEPIIQVRCNQCHDYTYGKLVNVFEEDFTDPDFGQLYLVDTTSTVESYLVRKLREVETEEAPFSIEFPVRYAGERMPSDGSDYLSPETEQVFLDWIDQGAFWN